jgi:hypothetical protein
MGLIKWLEIDELFLFELLKIVVAGKEGKKEREKKVGSG